MFTLHRIADLCVHTGQVTRIHIAEHVDRALRDGLLPGTTTAEAVDRIYSLCQQAQAIRRKRSARRVPPEPTLAERMARRTRFRVTEAYRRCGYRACVQGHRSLFKVGQPGVESRVVKGERYSSRCTYRKSKSAHTVTVPRMWIHQVERRGLAVCDGLMTLDAQPIPGHDDVELYAASWVAQGRGTQIILESGYLARLGQTTYHAPTGPGAIAGVRRKAGQMPARRIVDLDRLDRRYGHLTVVLDDSEAVGNCLAGTLSWCHAVGIDPEAPSVPLREVIAGYRLRPLPDALRVIRHVVRQHRQWERLLSEPRPEIRFDGEGGFKTV